MKLKKKNIYKSALYLAVEKGNIEIVKLLLKNNKIDANFTFILNLFLFIKLNITHFNRISNKLFQWNLKNDIFQ